MFTKKIQSLFQFIQFLHSNIENFKQFDSVINELNLLGNKRQKLKPNNNFDDKLKNDEVQIKINDKFKIIQEKIITPIKVKATELNICKFTNEPLYNWNEIESEINKLKDSFNKEDLPEILKIKTNYIEFRTETNCTYFQDIFFSSLDKLLKELFGYFSENGLNEFEAFEKETIQVNNINEAVKLFQFENKKCTCTNFISDRNKLCNECPINGIIQETISFQLIDEFLNYKKSLPINIYEEKIKDKIKELTKKVDEYFNKAAATKNKGERMGTYNKYYHWNNAKVTALNTLLNEAKDRENSSNPFDMNYNEMFVVSQIKNKFTNDLNFFTSKSQKNVFKYDLRNLDTFYTKNDDEVLIKAKQGEYNNEFILKLDRTTILEIQPFLNYQFLKSKNQKEFYVYVKYCTLNYKGENRLINDEGQRECIKDWIKENEKKFIDTPLLKALPPQQIETKTEQETIEMKPVFKPETLQIVFEIIKDFFSPEQQTELKQILETGNKSNNKLLFKSNGNRLTDTFKKLIEHDFITGCQKQDLINWIISNFTFTQSNTVKAFIYDTVEKTISRNDNPCKSPLIEIKNGQIQKIELPRIKKYNKH